MSNYSNVSMTNINTNVTSPQYPYAQATILLQPIKALIQTYYSVAFCDDIVKIYNALKNRPVKEARLYVADKWEYLNYLAQINQNRFCDVNTDEENIKSKLPLPAVIQPNTYLMQKNAKNFNDSMAIVSAQQGEWAISALNGFCTAATDNELCGLLEGGELKYPVAQYLLIPHENIVQAARQEYVRRFYSRYNHNVESLNLQQKDLEKFKDDYFEQREERLKQMSEEYRQFQQTRWAMGWF